MISHTIPDTRRLLLISPIVLFSLISSASQSEVQQTTAAGQTIKPNAADAVNPVSAPKTNLQADGSTQSAAQRDNSLWSVPLTSLTATRERPIFSPTRRPRTVAVKSAPAQSSVQPPFVLVGAIAGETEGLAIFQDGTTKNVIRLKTGESHAGWILQAVRPREAVLQNEQRNAVLTLPSSLAK